MPMRASREFRLVPSGDSRPRQSTPTCRLVAECALLDAVAEFFADEIIGNATPFFRAFRGKDAITKLAALLHCVGILRVDSCGDRIANSACGAGDSVGRHSNRDASDA